MSANKLPKLGEDNYKRLRSVQIKDRETTFEMEDEADYKTISHIEEWDEIKNDPLLSKYVVDR